MRILGTRRAIAEATAIGWATPEFGMPKVDCSGMTSNLGRICTLLEAAQVLRAVDAQPDEVKSWLYYCHGAHYRKSDGQTIKQHVMAQLYGPDKPWIRASREKPVERLSRMVSLAADDLRMRIRTNGAHHYLVKHIALVMQVDPTHWDRDWSDQFKRAQGVIDRLDKRGVARVSKLIDPLRWAA